MSVTAIKSSPLLKNLAGYAGGAFLPETRTTIPVVDPATGALIVHVPCYGKNGAEHAVTRAETALCPVVPASERRIMLEKVAEAHGEYREDLAQIITAENGKTIREARGEVDYAAGFYAEAARQLDALSPRVLEKKAKNHEWTVYSRPAGVAGLIVPWNFPLAMLAKKASAALAAGAPIVVKPSEKTPLSSIALFHIFHQLRLPPGLVNLVFGDAPAIGRVLCEHPAVRVISFTGSTAVGKELSAQATPHVKRLSLELGGNAPFIVLDDADLEQAASALMANKFRCSGQTCVASNRVYVHRSAQKELSQILTERVQALRVGRGSDPTSDVGPLIDRPGFIKVRELVQDALDCGAEVSVGGAAELPAEGSGLFYPPTFLQGVPAHARCMKEELFGPVIPLTTFDTDEEVLHAANGTEHGLAAYVFTTDLPRGEQFISQLRFGHVGLNTATGPCPEAPFGGMKQSGIGREGGHEGVLEFVELQTVPTPLA